MHQALPPDFCPHWRMADVSCDGLYQAAGGSEFPFIMFSPGFLTQVGFEAPWLEQYIHHPYPCLWWLSRMNGILESPPSSKSKRMAVLELGLSSVWSHPRTCWCLLLCSPWVLVLPKEIKRISAPSWSALLGDHIGVAFLPWCPPPSHATCGW